MKERKAQLGNYILLLQVLATPQKDFQSMSCYPCHLEISMQFIFHLATKHITKLYGWIDQECETASYLGYFQYRCGQRQWNFMYQNSQFCSWNKQC